jgi:hypothetical protein
MALRFLENLCTLGFRDDSPSVHRSSSRLLWNYQRSNVECSNQTLFLAVKGPAADTTDALQPWGLLCNSVMKMKIIFLVMEHRWNETDRGKPKNSGKNFVQHKSHMDWPRDRTRASAVGGRRLTAWAMARPARHRYCFKAWNTCIWAIRVNIRTKNLTSSLHKHTKLRSRLLPWDVLGYIFTIVVFSSCLPRAKPSLISRTVLNQTELVCKSRHSLSSVVVF